MNEDFEWFEQHYEEFQKTYGDSFLAIKNKMILGVYNDCATGVYETAKTEDLGTFIVQEVRRNSIAYLAYVASMGI